MPPHATPQRPRSETQTCPAVPAVLSIREEAALLRAAQAAGAISVTETTPEQLDAFFARRRVRFGTRAGCQAHPADAARRCWQAEALKTAEERWSLSFTEQGEPVPVEGGDWQWSIERQTDGARPARRGRGPARAAWHRETAQKAKTAPSTDRGLVARPAGAQAGACDDKTSAEAPLSPDSRTLARSHEVRALRDRAVTAFRQAGNIDKNLTHRPPTAPGRDGGVRGRIASSEAEATRCRGGGYAVRRCDAAAAAPPAR